MRYVDAAAIDDLPGRRIGENERFAFECRPDLDCFNRCCRNLNLFLYPYDVIRLKQRLNLTSDRFLDDYVDVVLRPGIFFPDVLLRMRAEPEHRCVFLSSSGCRVYPDRPGTCRMFPLEEGAFFSEGKNKPEMIHLLRPPDFCLGAKQSKQWAIRTWKQDQETASFNRMAVKWSQIKRLFVQNPYGAEGPDGPKAKMAFMAFYNLDAFREFVFASTFLKRYKIKQELKQKIEKDDTALLDLSTQWVKLYLFGLKSTAIRLR